MMKRNQNSYHADQVLIKGYVCYEDGEVVKNAIVILEQMGLIREVIYSMYTTTNRYGEFCFLIDDKDKYYKIKVFDTNYINKHHCNVNICL